MNKNLIPLILFWFTIFKIHPMEKLNTIKKSPKIASWTEHPLITRSGFYLVVEVLGFEISEEEHRLLRNRDLMERKLLKAKEEKNEPLSEYEKLRLSALRKIYPLENRENH